MNDNNGGLYFIVGALVVVVGLGVFLFNGGHFSRSSATSHTSIERSTTISPGGDSTTTVTREKTP
jgi:hypothetical protein